MRNLISALVVIAVVSCALAFTAKPLDGIFCASQTKNEGCAVIVKKEVTGVANFFIKSTFDGTNCTSTDCSTSVRLIDN